MLNLKLLQGTSIFSSFWQLLCFQSSNPQNTTSGVKLSKTNVPGDFLLSSIKLRLFQNQSEVLCSSFRRIHQLLIGSVGVFTQKSLKTFDCNPTHCTQRWFTAEYLLVSVSILHLHHQRCRRNDTRFVRFTGKVSLIGQKSQSHVEICVNLCDHNSQLPGGTATLKLLDVTKSH